MRLRNIVPLLALSALSVANAYGNDRIVSTSAYSWKGDSIVQGSFKAYAPSAFEIVSNYAAQPHYFMPIEKRWRLKNDISAYPQLNTPNKLHQAIYNMGLDEMINAVEPDTTLRTGKEWAGVWTRDVSYSIILSMAYLQPEASRISLMKKVNRNGRIIQDTGSGGAWPVSSDRLIWSVAAFEIYKVTGDKKWLSYIYPIIRDSFEDDFQVTYSEAGLVRGETSFIDWREQSYPKWMQTADIYQSEAMGTAVVHAAGLDVLSQIASLLGKKQEAARYSEKSKALAEAINEKFYMPEKGYYGMYRYGENFPILNPRAETLGESLAILFDVASPQRAAEITENNPTTPYGAAIFYPQIKDMGSYHNNALWPFVGSYWALANAKAQNEQGTLQAIGAVFRPAALFATNKENFNLDNGDIATELNSSNMLWSLSGNLAITYRILFGVHFLTDGLELAPFVPKALGDTRTLSGFKYRNATLNITVKGYGSKIASCTINGKPSKPFISSKAKGELNVVIEMADNDIAPLKVNNVDNRKAPLTPQVRAEMQNIDGVDSFVVSWNPIEYIAAYKVLRNGLPVATTHLTEYITTIPGEYQVIGLDSDGTESFASQPVSNQPQYIYQMPGEATTVSSPEVSYAPAEPVIGYRGNGFVEVDQSTEPITIDIDVEESGEYAITLRYANGNGPVNTENKCAIRTLLLDGAKAGTVVLPQRGVANWQDWGSTNSVVVALTAGHHTLTIAYKPENRNMNLDTNHALIDQLTLRRLN